MYPKLFRKRLIPNECIPLDNDEILFMDEEIMVTKWRTLKPRDDFHHGYSCYFFKEGIKVSQFLREDGSLFLWYCDIVSFSPNEEQGTLTITDLLADVTVDYSGKMTILDIDELCEAREKNFITAGQFFNSVKQLGKLIEAIQQGRFSEYTDRLSPFLGK
ncbi:MAG: DUF402 domain-containing protein [Lachnospiraceae bacterium]|jgi:protein associated with RNAse G/E|nr:DUF402 domain-containing protein [Lachnospiraceae bacterium]